MQSNQRPGLIMIVAALLVMLAMGYLLFDYERNHRAELARAQGIDLVRLLGGMPFNQLAPATGQQSFLEVLKRGQSNADFAYAAIVDVDGQMISEVTRSGVIIPLATIAAEPANWLGQRIVAAVVGNSRFIETHGPIFQDGRHMGFVRLGFYEPGISFGYRDVPFLATLMLPIFLLVPLFYFLMRQEIKPLKQISESVEKLAGHAGLSPVELQPTAELSDFMAQFSGYIEATQNRIDALNQQHEDLQMSGKLLTYRNSRIDAILQNFPDAIVVIDEADEVSYVNGKTHRLLGIESGAILGKKAREWCDIDEIIPLLTFGDAKSSIQANQNTVDIRTDDVVKSLQFNVYPLFVPNNESRILGRLVVIRDVSENYLMRQQQNEFISHVSHELKTPLNVLSMYSESLLTEGADNEEYRIEAVNVIHDEVERLSTLINNLLAINQHEFGGVVAQRSSVRMHEFLQDTFEGFSRMKNYQDLDFELDIPREMGLVYIDKDLLRIAINNLLSNAVKYNKPGGRVSLSASEDHDSVQIVVADEGYGIDAEDGKQIFDKFFRSTNDEIRKQVGHGLGLSLTRQIVLMHHGELDFESEPGKGSRFFIRLEKLSAQIVDAAS